MPRGFESPRRPWWRNLKATPAMGVAVAVLVGGYFGGRFFRGVDDASTVSSAVDSQRSTARSDEGTLRVNLNTATLAELQSIPGVGAVLARQIVANRPYTSVDELQKIRGFGDSSLKGLRDYVKVEGETEKLR